MGATHRVLSHRWTPQLNLFLLWCPARRRCILHLNQNFHFGIKARITIPPTASVRAIFHPFQFRATPSAHGGASPAPYRYKKTRNWLILRQILRQPHVPSPSFDQFVCQPPALSGRHRQRIDAPDHAHEQPPREMALGQHQPVVPRMLDQPAASLHQPLLQAGQRPVFKPWQLAASGAGRASQNPIRRSR